MLPARLIQRDPGSPVNHYKPRRKPVFNQTTPTAFMPQVQVKKGEPVERALKRLKSKLEAEGIIDEMRRLRAFETPTEKNQRKARLAFKRGRYKFRYTPDRSAAEEAAEATPAAAE